MILSCINFFKFDQQDLDFLLFYLSLNVFLCSVMVMRLDFRSSYPGSNPSRGHYSMRLDRGIYASIHPIGVVHQYQSGWTKKITTGCSLIWKSYILCLQFSIDNYYLWALTEYGDSLQSLVITRLGKKRVGEGLKAYLSELPCHEGITILLLLLAGVDTLLGLFTNYSSFLPKSVFWLVEKK